jgi:hypothetical protein
MALEKALQEAHCSAEFITIAQLYKSDFSEDGDIELFIESVETRHAVVESVEFDKALEKKAIKAQKLVEMSDMFNEEADEVED